MEATRKKITAKRKLDKALEIAITEAEEVLTTKEIDKIIKSWLAS